MSYKLITCESVSDGHPDKIADQISDAVLDAALAQDPKARVACEVMVKDKWVCVAGEISFSGTLDYNQIVGQVLAEIYHQPVTDFELVTHISQQSIEIAQGVDHEWDQDLGAGDQGVMYGYACDDNPQLMPMPALLAHALMKKHKQVRANNPLLGADAKAQVTLMYHEGKPQYVDTVIVSSQHDERLDLADLKDLIIKDIITPVIPTELMHAQTKVVINPAGSFIQGGPSADCGLTGRKIIVDTYGGVAHHGGGAFSGKDATKVDRTAAYMARFVAKQVVAAKLAAKCEVQLAYAIGQSQPVAISVDTFGTATVEESVILDKIKAKYDFSTKAMIKYLDLTRPIFRQTAAFGHFGREADLPWERIEDLEL